METIKPIRSYKSRIIAMLKELEVKYNAPINGKFIREAAKYMK